MMLYSGFISQVAMIFVFWMQKECRKAVRKPPVLGSAWSSDCASAAARLP